MANDKDSAVLAEKANIEWLAQQLLDWPDKRTDEAKTMAIGTLHRMASATILSQHQELAALRQPTQSDALREAVIDECAKALEADAKKCDCFARNEGECGCGAWCEWKSITSQRAIEIVHALKELSK